MLYLVDACNLIFRDSKLEATLDQRGFPAARDLLVEMLTRFARAARIKTVVCVFDGSEKGAHRPRRHTEAHGLVTLIYADPRSDADRYIIDYVQNASRPGEITVITSDKGILRAIKHTRTHHLGCRDFLRRLKKTLQKAADAFDGEDPRKFTARELTPREIEDWAKWCGLSK